MKLVALAALCAALGGCASANYVMDQYSGVAIKEVRIPDDTYRIYDKPSENKLMVTSSLGSAAGQGFVKGLTFGTAQTEPPKPLYEAAALQFLNESGRPGCRIKESYLLMQPQWEVKYGCSPMVAATAPQLSRRGR